MNTLGSRFRRIYCKVLVLWLCSGVAAHGNQGNPCAMRLLGYPFLKIETRSGAAPFSEVFRSYDPTQDMVFFFDKDLHAALFAGDYYWNQFGAGDGASITVHEHPRMIRRGIGVRVRIGSGPIKALTKTFKERTSTKAYSNSCHVNQLAFLQRHGVFLKGGPKILGSSTFRAILQDGFINAAGNTLPTQEIVVIEQPGENKAKLIEEKIGKESGNSIGHLIFTLGLPTNEFIDLLKQFCGDSGVQDLLTQNPISFGSPALDHLAERLESLTIERAQKLTGDTYRLIDIVAYERELMPAELVHEQLKEVIREACKHSHPD